MSNRETLVTAIENAKKISEENALDSIIVPFKEADMIIALLKEQEPQSVIFDRQCEVEPGRWERKGFCPKCHQVVLWIVNREYCGFCGQKVKWE